MCQWVIFDFSILFSGGSLFPGGPARPLGLNTGCDSPFERAELDLCIPALLGLPAEFRECLLLFQSLGKSVFEEGMNILVRADPGRAGSACWARSQAQRPGLAACPLPASPPLPFSVPPLTAHSVSLLQLFFTLLIPHL